MNPNSFISIQNLSKKYPNADVFALKELNLKIPEGQIFGFLGPNGAGKTTFFSLLSGLFKPSSGTISIFGLTLNENREQIKKIMGVVPQDIALYPTLSGKQNLMYIGRMYGLQGDTLNKRVNELLSFFDFQQNMDKKVINYSGGMKRKINLIAGLLHQPKVLLLDEPTAGMDVQSRIKMMQHLTNLSNKEKMTILYTSHYMEQAQIFCQRVAIIDQGRLLKSGPPDDLIKQENAKSLEDILLSLTLQNVNG